MRLEGKQIGVLVALILGVIMVMLPAGDNRRYSFEPSELADMIKGNSDQIDPVTLSEWIIEGRRDYLLVDIRAEEKFAAGSIKGAENIPMEKLLLKDTIDTLPEDKLVVIYSNGVSHSSQAWLILKSAGFDAYVLEGGYNYWMKVVMNPEAPKGELSDDEILRYKARVAVSNYLGGGAGKGSTVENQPVKKKKIIRRSRKKKKLKGC